MEDEELPKRDNPDTRVADGSAMQRLLKNEDFKVLLRYQEDFVQRKLDYFSSAITENLAAGQAAYNTAREFIELPHEIYDTGVEAIVEKRGPEPVEDRYVK